MSKTEDVAATPTIEFEDGTKTKLDPVTVQYLFPETLQEAADMFGEEIALNHLCSSVRVALQSFIRSQAVQNYDGTNVNVKEVQSQAKNWKPSVRKPGKSPAEKAREQLAKLDPETRKALLGEMSK